MTTTHRFSTPLVIYIYTLVQLRRQGRRDETPFLSADMFRVHVSTPTNHGTGSSSTNVDSIVCFFFPFKNAIFHGVSRQVGKILDSLDIFFFICCLAYLFSNMSFCDDTPSGGDIRGRAKFPPSYHPTWLFFPITHERWVMFGSHKTRALSRTFHACLTRMDGLYTQALLDPPWFI